VARYWGEVGGTYSGEWRAIGDDGSLLTVSGQAHEHHRKMLQSLPSTTYPLEPVGAPAEVPESQRVSDEPFGQR